MDAKNVQSVDINMEKSSSGKRGLDLNEENEKYECDSDAECSSADGLPTENNKDNSGRSKRCKLKICSLIQHSSVSSEEWPGTLVKNAGLRNNIGENYFDQLPDEMVLRVFCWLPQRYLFSLGLVCHRFNRLIQDLSLWIRMSVSGRTISGTSFWKILNHQVIMFAAPHSTIQGLVLPPSLSNDFKVRLSLLNLNSVRISQSTLVTLFNRCTQLKKLSLANISLNNEVLIALSANKGLEVLDFGNCKGIREEGLEYLLTNCRKIREWNIGGTFLNVPSSSYLCKNLPASVKKLNVSGCANITEDCLANLVRCCPHLQEFDFTFCTTLTKAVIIQIIELKALKYLALSSSNLSCLKSFLLLKKIDSLSDFNFHCSDLNRNEMINLRNILGPKVRINKYIYYYSVATWNQSYFWFYLRRKHS